MNVPGVSLLTWRGLARLVFIFELVTTKFLVPAKQTRRHTFAEGKQYTPPVRMENVLASYSSLRDFCFGSRPFKT